MLGFVIYPDGIKIYLERIEFIKVITPPHNKKAMQYFLGKINFVRRFIFDFVEIVKPIQEMIKKDTNFKLTNERREEFEKIQEA